LRKRNFGRKKNLDDSDVTTACKSQKIKTDGQEKGLELKKHVNWQRKKVFEASTKRVT
jgi:hypothetical protein